MLRRRHLLILALSLFLGNQALAQSPDEALVEVLLERSRAYFQSWSDTGLERVDPAAAAAVLSVLESPAYAARLVKERRRIERELFAGEMDASKSVAAKGFLRPDERLYLFVSSSMPMETLRTYAADLARLGEQRAVLVLRGLVEGAQFIGPTLAWAHQVLKVDPQCRPENPACEMRTVELLIDPLLFRRFGVSLVPALVVARGVRVRDPALSEGLEQAANLEDYFMLIGDASLDFMLEKIERAWGEKFTPRDVFGVK